MKKLTEYKGIMIDDKSIKRIDLICKKIENDSNHIRTKYAHLLTPIGHNKNEIRRDK